jgi:uridine kinase
MGFGLPYFIGIVGGSCAGKTWLADRLHDEFGKEAGRLSLDNFYVDRKHLTEAQADRVNFDHPRSIEWERLTQALNSFAKGEAARIPQYNYRTHSRHHEEIELRPLPIIIMEGLWLFRRPSVRRNFDLRIFIKSAVDLCERRRLERDVRERGRTPEQVLQQFRETVAPSYDRFIAPQERWANLILETPPDQETVRQIALRVQEEVKAKL